MIKHRVIGAIEETGIIAIVRGVAPEGILPLASALYDGGIRVIEVTCNSTRHLESISALKQEMGDKMYVGAGTVINPVMAQLVLDAGADFVLSPDFNPDVVSMVHEKQRLMIPAVMTPSEILQACRLGVDLLKLFPANSLGVNYMKEIQGPLDNLSLIRVGSALTNKAWIARGDWGAIAQQAKAFIHTFHDGKRA